MQHEGLNTGDLQKDTARERERKGNKTARKTDFFKTEITF